MSKRIDDRRSNSANVPADQRALIVDRVVAKNKGSLLKGFLFAVAILIAVVALVLIILNSIVNSYYSKISTGDYNSEKITVADQVGNMDIYKDAVLADTTFHNMKDKVLLNFASASSDIKVDENVFNYVLIGVDKFTDDASTGQADIIVVASMNKRTNKVTYLMLDTKVLAYIPGADVIGPIQDAYEWGGAALLAKTVSHNLGIDINGYVEINVKGFFGTVDAVGGISLILSDEDILKINASMPELEKRFGIKNVDEVVKGSDGKVTLNGAQALAYIRGTSVDRSSAVMNVLKETTKNAVKNGFGGVKLFINALTANAVTSATKEDFASLFRLVFASVKKTNVETIVYGKDTVNKSEWGVNIVDYAAERAIVVSALYGATE